MADVTPSPWPAGSRLLQARGCLALTLPQGESLRPTQKPRGQALTLEQQRTTQVLHLTFRTLFRSSGAILAEPPEERRGRALHGLFHTL